MERLRELDRLRLEVETLSEFRTKVLESQASLQKELKKVSKIYLGTDICECILVFL